MQSGSGIPSSRCMSWHATMSLQDDRPMFAEYEALPVEQRLRQCSNMCLRLLTPLKSCPAAVHDEPLHRCSACGHGHLEPSATSNASAVHVVWFPTSVVKDKCTELHYAAGQLPWHEMIVGLVIVLTCSTIPSPETFGQGPQYLGQTRDCAVHAYCLSCYW